MKGYEGKAIKSRSLMTVGSLLAIFIVTYFAQFTFFHPIFAAVLAAVIAFAYREFCGLARARGANPASQLGIGFSIVYVFAILLASFYSFWVFLPKIVLLCCLFALFLRQLNRPQNAIKDIATAAFGVVYITLPLAMILPVVSYSSEGHLYEGRWWLLYLLFVTKFSDIGGFLIGGAIGKRKLAPSVSPGKTLEGAIAGFFFSFAVSIALWYWWGVKLDLFSLQGWEAFWLGILVPIVGQVGDLAESLLKRDAQVKDSSTIPGMGGILDMVDSVLFTIPIVYLFLKL